MVKGIDLSMKWNDYTSDTLYLWNGTELYKIAEGDGSNLFLSDEEEGYKDYWLTDIASKTECNGGQWMETELISNIDYTIQGVIERMMECDLWEDDWKVVDEDLGDKLMQGFEKCWEVERLIREI